MKESVLVGLAIIILLGSNTKFGALGGIFEDFNSGFCLTAPKDTKCPNPLTYDLVDITAFGGKWYEIGSSANFKLNKEAGIACSATNFTVMGSSQLWALKANNLTFVDNGVKVLGSVAQNGVQQVAGAARGLCQNARDICKLLADGSQMDQALKLIVDAGNKILLLHHQEFATLQSARASLGSAIRAVNVALSSLSRDVTQIQFMDSQLSQGNGSAKDNMPKLMNAIMKTGRVQDDILRAVKTIADARGKIIVVAAQLVATIGIDMPIRAVPELGEAAVSLAATEFAILELAAAIRLATFSMTAGSGLIPLDTGNVRDVVSAYPGLAIQNTSSAGRLEAVWGSRERAPYLILAVDGLPHSGYDSALVYSCTESPGRPYKQALFIISRTPTLSQLVTDHYMRVAALHGISNDCDDPFMFTVQNSPFCVPPSASSLPVSP